MLFVGASLLAIAVCQSLFFWLIHRNSLRYRMERIAELSGVDPLRLDGMLALYLGVQLLPESDIHP